MTTEVLSQALTGGVKATFGQGRVFYIKTATSALNIEAKRAGGANSVRKFINIGAGFKFTADVGEGWDLLEVTSAVGQTLEIVVGDDDVDVANAVSVSGVANIQETPSATISASAADVSVGNGAASAIAGNAARRRITVCALSTNTGSLRIQSPGAGANKGLELQPGIFIELRTTAAFDIRNDSGASQSYSVFEES